MSGVTVTLQGGEKLIARLERAESRVERKIALAVASSAIRIQALARQAAPVDTGRLRSSIFVRFLDGGLSAEVRTDVQYASFQEFGTRHIPPRPFLGPAYNDEAPKFLRRIEKILKEAVA